MKDMVTHRLDQPQGPHSDDFGGIFRNVEGDLDVALGSEVIHFIGVDCFEHAPQARSIAEVAIVQSQRGAAEMRVVIDGRCDRC